MSNPKLYTVDMRDMRVDTFRVIGYRLSWAPDTPGPTPADSPLKVWDGSAWVAASAPPTS